MTKKILSSVFCLLLSISAFAYSGGNGKEHSPYLISSKADMEELATNVNAGQTYSGFYFLLTKDITEAVTTIIGCGDINVPYTLAKVFSGTFDGKGHKINVNIIGNGFYMQDYHIGIFAYTRNAVIKNLGVSGNISRKNNYSEYIDAYVGSICGTAENTEITNCYNTAYISVEVPEFSYVGGICGNAYWGTTITNCYNTADISVISSVANIGGICGSFGSSVQASTLATINCYNTGNISINAHSTSKSAGFSVGGICGYVMNNTISNCYNIGNISAPVAIYGISLSSYLGGIVGTGYNISIFDCFAANTTLKGSGCKRIVGSFSGIIENCYALATMQINGTTINNQNANNENGKDAIADNFKNQSWIESNLHWDFTNTWTIKDVGQFPELLSYQKVNIIFNLPEISYADQVSLTATSNNNVSPIIYTSSNNSIAEITGNLLIAKKAGNVTITASQPMENGFFAGEKAVNITIKKATLTITAENKERRQGEENPPFTLLYSGFKNNENENVLDVLPTISCEADIHSPAGLYDIVLSDGSDKNYSYNLINGQLAVGIAMLSQTIEFEELPQKTYGDASFYLPSVTNKGLVISYQVSNENVATVQGNTVTIHNAGSTEITASQSGDEAHFAAIPVTRTLIVQKANQSITFRIYTQTYGRQPDNKFVLNQYSDACLEITYKSDNESVATVSGHTVTIISAGSAYITATQEGNDNYNAATPFTEYLYVNKAALTITADNKERNYGEENPEFTLSYSGFVNNENENVLDILPTIFCEADIHSPAGLYDIVLSGGSDKNYSYNLINGELEVKSLSGIAEINSAKISIYPNPAKSYLFIQSDKPVSKVEIYNLSGRCIMTNEKVMERINISGLANGMYLIRFYMDGVHVIKKFTVKK